MSGGYRFKGGMGLGGKEDGYSLDRVTVGCGFVHDVYNSRGMLRRISLSRYRN